MFTHHGVRHVRPPGTEWVLAQIKMCGHVVSMSRRVASTSVDRSFFFSPHLPLLAAGRSGVGLVIGFAAITTGPVPP